MDKQPMRHATPQARRRQIARQQNSRRHNRRRRKNYILHYILGFVMIVAVGITLSLTVFFNIAQLQIVGNRQTEEHILEVTGLSLGDNLFRINTDDAADKLLAAVTDVDGVKVERQLPDTLKVTFSPATVQAICYSENAYYSISEKGRIIAKDTTLAQDYEGVLFSGVALQNCKVGDFLTESNDLEMPLAVLEELRAAGLADITQMAIDTNGEVTLSYQDRVTIQLGSRVEMDYKLQIVQKVLSEHVGATEEGIIDARIASVAYFRPMTMAVQIAEGKALDVTNANQSSDGDTTSTEGGTDDGQDSTDDGQDSTDDGQDSTDNGDEDGSDDTDTTA